MEVNSLKCAHLLIRSGANVKLQARDSRDPLTAILHFYGDERFQLFKYLHKYGDYKNDEIEPYFLTLLHKAVAGERDIVNLKCVNHLIENGEDINAKDGKSR